MAFTGGENVPSARYRVRQFIPALAGNGVALQEWHGRAGCYPTERGWRRPAWAASRIAELLPAAIGSRRADVVLLQREMISTVPSLEFMTRSPRLLDVDDSIHLFRGGWAARKLAMLSDRVICGNDFLADVYAQWHDDVVVLPTAVDTSRYTPAPARAPGPLVIGWIGTSANHGYLLGIEQALSKAMSGQDAILKVVSDSRPSFRHLQGDQVQFLPWNADGEIAAIQGFDIGLMPLQDNQWARGKCSFKMLQYMACGLPVVVSPVGMNRQVLDRGRIGLAASSDADWVDAIRTLLVDDQARRAMGIQGQRVAEDHYSVAEVAPRLAKHIREIAGEQV